MILIGLLFIVFLAFPEITSDGIRNGLVLLENQVIPALYPFILLTSLLRCRGNKKDNNIFLLAVGFLSGYPLGAKIVADNDFKQLPVSNNELLLLCNNPSPGYMMSFVGFACMKDIMVGIKIYIAIVIGNILTVIVKCLIRHAASKDITNPLSLHICERDAFSFDMIIRESFSSLLNISTYILIFSVGANFISKITILPEDVQNIFIGLLEMTTGIERISSSSIGGNVKNIIITGIISFGGFSVITQTYSMIKHSDLSIKKYMIDKAIASAIAMSIMYFFTSLLN